MHRPLRVPFHLRIWQFTKNLLFLNRLDWTKASDGLNMPTLSREERERQRPRADLEIIKPREKPRARLDTFRGAEISKPGYQPQASEPVGSASPSEEAAEGREPGSNRPPGEYVKRRRYKRRRAAGATGGDGFFRRVFGKSNG